MLENSLENKIFWNNFAHVKISCFTRILHHAKCNVNIKFYNINFHEGKWLILPDQKPNIKLHVLIKTFVVFAHNFPHYKSLSVLFRPSVHVMRHKPLWTEHLGNCHRSQLAVNTGFNFKKNSPPEDPLKLSEHLPYWTFFFHVTGHSIEWTLLPVNTKGHMSQPMNSWSK